MPVPEAPLRETKFGLVPDGDGWFSHGATVDRETTKPAEAYARFPPSPRTRYREGSLPDV